MWNPRAATTAAASVCRAQKLIELHGGKLEIGSEFGRETTVRISLAAGQVGMAIDRNGTS
jgi:hypothetical protein